MTGRAGVDAGVCEGAADRLGLAQRGIVPVEHGAEGHVTAAGDMAAREIGPGARILAGEARGRARVHDLGIPRAEGRADLLERADQSVVVSRRERSRRDSRALRSPADGLPPASAAGRRQGPRHARARRRGTSTTPGRRCRGLPCRRPRRASRCRRRVQPHYAQRALLTAACEGATNPGRRSRRCRRTRRPGCGPPGTRRPGSRASVGRCQEPSRMRTALSAPPYSASHAGLTTSGASPPLMPFLRTPG